MGRLALGVALLLGLMGLAVAQEVGELMGKADALWPQRGDMAKLKESMELYEKVLAQDSINVEALWRLSRACWWLGTHSPEEQKLAIFEKGIEYGKRAILLKEDCAPCHYWLGVNYGVYGEAKGVLKSLSLVDPIREEMNRVIQLEPGFMHGGAYRILGRMAYKLPWFAGGEQKGIGGVPEKGLGIRSQQLFDQAFSGRDLFGHGRERAGQKRAGMVHQCP